MKTKCSLKKNFSIYSKRVAMLIPALLITITSLAQTLEDVENYNRQRLDYYKVYDDFVQLIMSVPNSVEVGEKFKLEVCLHTSPAKFPYNENTDRSKQPTINKIEGCEVISGPTQSRRVFDSSNGGKTYDAIWTWTLRATSPGVKEVKSATMTYRGKFIRTNFKKIFVKEAKTVDLGNVEKYIRPLYSSRSDSQIGVDSIITTAAYTKVYMNFAPNNSSNLSISKRFYIKDNATEETYTLTDIDGISPERQMVRGGKEYKFCLTFKPMPENAKNIDIVEPVENGFVFRNVMLKKRETTNVALSSKRGNVFSQLSYAPNHATLELNKYDSDFLFTDGMLPIYNSETGYWGFVNESGRLVIPYQYKFNTFDTPHFDSGYCLVAEKTVSSLGIEGKKWYIIDKKGVKKYLPNVIKVSNFCDGYARVIKRVGKSYRETIINVKGLEPFLNLAQVAGSMTSPIPVRPFNDGLSAFYHRTKEAWGFINKSGKVVIPAIYKDVQDFSEGVAAVETKTTATEPSRWIFINTKGQQAFSKRFTKRPSSFKAGRATVTKTNGYFVAINHSGEVVSPDYYWLSKTFSNGNSIARINNKYYILDSEYNRTAELPLGAGESFPHMEFKEVNGLFQLQKFVGSTTTTFSTDGKRFNFNLGELSPNLIHVKVDGYNAFSDYDGNIVFSIKRSEF